MARRDALFCTHLYQQSGRAEKVDFENPVLYRLSVFITDPKSEVCACRFKGFEIEFGSRLLSSFEARSRGLGTVCVLWSQEIGPV
mgnify:CR=1 FL=1